MKHRGTHRRYPKHDRPPITPRTASIRSYIARQLAATGATPTVAEVAAVFAMSPIRVEYHYRALGLL